MIALNSTHTYRDGVAIRYYCVEVKTEQGNFVIHKVGARPDENPTLVPLSKLRSIILQKI